MLLTGTFVRSLDEKLRVAVPKRLREDLQPVPETALYLVPGTDRSLALYAEPELQRLAARMSAASPAQQEVRAFNRLFYAQAQRVEIDVQGRVRLPTELAQLAGLTKEVVLLGVHDHVELWDRQVWDQYLAQRIGHYDELAERALGQAPRNEP